jgi:hypothetical protein
MTETIPQINGITGEARVAFVKIYKQIRAANPRADGNQIAKAAIGFLTNKMGYRVYENRLISPREQQVLVARAQAAQQRAQTQHRPAAKKRPAFGSGMPIYAMGKRIL